MNDFNSWDEVKEWLESGKGVTCNNIWWVNIRGMDCYEGCCGDDHEGIDDAMRCVVFYSDNDLKGVKKNDW